MENTISSSSKACAWANRVEYHFGVTRALQWPCRKSSHLTLGAGGASRLRSAGCWCQVSAAALPAARCLAHRQGWDSELLFLRQVGYCCLTAGWLCLLLGSLVFQTDIAVCRQCSDRCQAQTTAARCSWCSVGRRLWTCLKSGLGRELGEPQGGWNFPSCGRQAVWVWALCAVQHSCPAPARCSVRCRGQKFMCCSVGKAIGSMEIW